jgi:hypothetical protein
MAIERPFAARIPHLSLLTTRSRCKPSWRAELPAAVATINRIRPLSKSCPKMADNVSLVLGESARLERQAKTEGFLPCCPLGPSQGAGDLFRPGPLACEFFQCADIFCRPRSSFHCLVSSRSPKSKGKTKSIQRFADIDLNHTFILFRRLDGRSGSAARRRALCKAFSDRASGFSGTNGASPTADETIDRMR